MKRMAWGLSLAGLLPFVALSIGVAFDLLAHATTALIAYAAVILSFLGGIQWGVSMMSREDDSRSAWVMGMSIAPSLVAWGSLLTPQLSLAFIIALAGLASALAVDRALMRMAMLPLWFWQLRVRITAIVSFCLLLALFTHAG